MIWSGNKTLTSIKVLNSVTNWQKMMGNNPNLALLNINVYTKFCQILSILALDMERKQNSDIIQRQYM